MGSKNIDCALKKAREELVKGEGEPFDPEDMSVIFSYYLESKGVQLDQSTKIPPDFPLAGREVLADEDYLQMVNELSRERLRVGEDAPSLRIDPLPAGQLKGGINFGLIFGTEMILFQETVQALQVDALWAESEVNVLGVRIDWLSPDRRGAERALIVDDTGLVKWVRFQQPVPLDVVQILELPRPREILWHRELSRDFQDNGIELINPYKEGSERADDKARTHLLWHRRQGLQIPRFCLIPRWSPQEEILRKLKRFLKRLSRGERTTKIVLQPNKGTEGYRVEGMEVDLSEITAHHPAVQYLEESILPEDDALIREERGNLRYYREPTPGNRPFALRIHVAWDGGRFVAESGYAQLARDETSFVASPGRGGEIIDLQKAFAHLYYLKDNKWAQYMITPEDISRIKRAAVQAAYGLNAGLEPKDYLKFMGIDMVLEVKETETGDKLIPVLLEANSRPAGLIHAKELLPSDQSQARWRVSTGIFHYLKDLKERSDQ